MPENLGCINLLQAVISVYIAGNLVVSSQYNLCIFIFYKHLFIYSLLILKEKRLRLLDLKIAFHAQWWQFKFLKIIAKFLSPFRKLLCFKLRFHSKSTIWITATCTTTPLRWNGLRSDSGRQFTSNLQLALYCRKHIAPFREETCEFYTVHK